MSKLSVAPLANRTHARSGSTFDAQAVMAQQPIRAGVELDGQGDFVAACDAAAIEAYLASLV